MMFDKGQWNPWAFLMSDPRAAAMSSPDLKVVVMLKDRASKRHLVTVMLAKLAADKYQVVLGIE